MIKDRIKCQDRKANVTTVRAFLMVLLLGSFLSVEGQITLSRIDSTVRSQSETLPFEGSVLIADQGEVIYHESFGYVDTAAAVPVENGMRFGIASITKLFTAIAVLQQVEEGKYSLHDNLRTLLPELKIKDGKKITVRHLLLHIGGLPNEEDAIYEDHHDPLEFVQITLKNNRGKIGTFNYSNIDYVLLGMIVGKVDNGTWQQSIRNRILKPLGMENTGFLVRGGYPENFANSYSYYEGQRLADPEFHIENFDAAGCMYSTAEDLLKLDRALYTDELLNEASKQAMYTSYPEYNYSGYSVWTYQYPFLDPAPLVMERRGGIMGSNVVLVRFLELDRTLVILSNNSMFNPSSFGDTNNLKEALMLELGK